MKLDSFPRRAQRSLAHTIASTPRREQCLLCRQNTVEAGEQKRRPLRGVSLKLSAELERKSRAAQQFAITAEFVECSEPPAERSGVLIPADARIVFEKLWSVVAEQMVPAHGERSQAIARAGELYSFGRGMGHNTRPERLLLKRAQHDAVAQIIFTNPLIPGRASETVPILNLGRGPCGQPFSTAGAMKGQSERSRRALAGSDYDSAAAQPRIDGGQFRVHNSQCATPYPRIPL